MAHNKNIAQYENGCRTQPNIADVIYRIVEVFFHHRTEIGRFALCSYIKSLLRRRHPRSRLARTI